MWRAQLLPVSLYLCMLVFGLSLGYVTPQLVAWMAPATSLGMDESTASADVVMYASAGCQFCAQARAYLRSRHIPFEERDITQPGKARDRFRALGGKGTPLLLVGGRKLTGFNRQELDAALAALHPPGP